MSSTDTRTEYAQAAARNVALAHEGLAATAPRTRETNHFLCDLNSFDERVKRGELAAFAGGLRTALSIGGLQSVAFAGESVDDVRAAVRAYGEWLIQVADVAR